MIGVFMAGFAAGAIAMAIAYRMSLIERADRSRAESAEALRLGAEALARANMLAEACSATWVRTPTPAEFAAMGTIVVPVESEWVIPRDLDARDCPAGYEEPTRA